MSRNTLRNPFRGMNPLRFSQQGFSLVEVIMTVVLLSIGITLALPSYHDMVEKRQITNGAEQLASFINTAQSVAIKTNEVVTISYSKMDKDDWCVGATSGTTACDCTETNATEEGYCQITSQPFVLNASHFGDPGLIHGIKGDGAYVFDPNSGLLTDLDDSLTVEMRSPGEEFRLDLRVSSNGQVLLCSGDTTHDVPGYAVCPAKQGEEGT